MKSDKRLYLNVTRDRVVEEGDPEAAYLMVGAGDEVPAEHLEAYKAYSGGKKAAALVVTEVPSVAADPPKAEARKADVADEPKVEAKAAEPAENKAQARSETKAK